MGLALEENGKQVIREVVRREGRWTFTLTRIAYGEWLKITSWVGEESEGEDRSEIRSELVCMLVEGLYTSYGACRG